MKFTINFAQKIGEPCINTQCQSSETIENLEIIISLTYNNMENCNLIYQGTVLKNKSKKLHQVFKSDQTNVITVAPKNQIESFISGASRTTQKYAELFKQNPQMFAGGVALVLILLMIFLS